MQACYAEVKYTSLDTTFNVLGDIVKDLWNFIGFGCHLDGHIGSHLEFGLLQPRDIDFIVRNELLAPQNPTLDTKIIVLGGMVNEIWDFTSSGGHHGGHLEFGTLQPWNNVFIVRNELLTPKYPTLDTKIIVLGGIVIEICHTVYIGGHLGGHLEF